MANLLQGIGYVIIFGGLLLGGWAFLEENSQPTLHAGTFHNVVVFSAALLVGPAVGITLGQRARDWVRHELNDMIERGYPSSYQLLSSLALQYKTFYYVLLAVGAALPIGYGAFGATKLIDHRYNELIGETTCVIDATAQLPQGRIKVRLQCPGPNGSAEIELMHPYRPVRLPDEVTLPVYKGVLDSVFVDGRNFSL
jgi:hypothetical protein